MRLLIPVILFFLLIGCENSVKREVKRRKYQVAIQPLGEFPEELINLVQIALNQQYGFETAVLNEMELPQRAFIEAKSPRYRADTLIRILRDQRPDSVGIIFGLTRQDISITKYAADGSIKKPEYKYSDFGIFGLGFKPGTSSVVSTL